MPSLVIRALNLYSVPLSPRRIYKYSSSLEAGEMWHSCIRRNMGLLGRSYNRCFIGEWREGECSLGGEVINVLYQYQYSQSLYWLNCFVICCCSWSRVVKLVWIYCIWIIFYNLAAPLSVRRISCFFWIFFFFLLALALATDLLGLLRETEQKQSFVQLLSLTLLADWIHLQHFHPNNHQLV